MLTHQHNGGPWGLRDRQVWFRVSDACVPKHEEILGELHGHDLLQGKIIDLTDSGAVREAFAVLEVPGVSRSVVVPVAKIVSITAQPA